MRPLEKRSRRRSRSIAIALTLLAFAAIMFLVTLVKLEQQVHRNGTPQTRGEMNQVHILTSDITAHARREVLAWGSG